MMKKKLMVSLLTASLIAASVVPAYGAEFISEPAETTFSAGEELISEEPEGLEEVQEVSSAESTAGYRIEIATPPKRTTCYYDVDIRMCYQYSAEGLSINKVLDNGTISESVFFEPDESLAEGDSGQTYSWILWSKAEEKILDTFDSVTPGEYELRAFSNENSSVYASVDIHVGDAKDAALPLQKSGDSIYGLTVPMNSDLMIAWAKFVPEKTGYYKITATESDYLNEPSLRVVNDQMYDRSPGNNGGYSLEKGQAYYISYSDYSGSSGRQLDITFKVEELPQLIGMEWVKKPTNTFLYSGLNVRPYEHNGRYIVSGDRYIDGKVKLTYSDGYSEVVNINEPNQYGDGINIFFYVADEKEPKPGTYESLITAGENREVYLTTNIEVRDTDTLPLINVKGSKTIPYSFENSWMRLKTGSVRGYTLKVNIKEPELQIYLKRKDSEDATFTVNGGQVVLQPHTEYILFLGGGQPENHKGSMTYTVTPGKIDIAQTAVYPQLKAETAVYTGKPIKMAAHLETYSDPIKLGKDYTISYKNNVKIGSKATVIFKGKGEYTGTIKKTFRIVPKKVTIKSAKRTGNTSAKLTWKKVNGATGYMVYRTTGKKWVKVANVRATSFTDKSLKKGTTYKYKVRAYGKEGKKNIYGSYSSSKTVK